MIANNLLYGYVFWHNGYINKWYAIPRSEQADFFSGKLKHDSFMSATSFNKLIKMVAENETNKISETSEQNPDVEKIVLCDVS